MSLAAAVPTAPVAMAASRNPTPAQIDKAVARAKTARTLWATVNICNSSRYPNTIGIRGQMPSLGFPSWLSMQIQLNYYAKAKHRFVADPGSVKTIRLGRSSSGLQQGGALYAFKPHAGLLQATVRFFWRRLGVLLGTTQMLTTAGHPSADFGSPSRFSAAQCHLP